MKDLKTNRGYVFFAPVFIAILALLSVADLGLDIKHAIDLSYEEIDA